MSVIDVIGTPVAQVLKGIHTGLSSVIDPASGAAWGLSIVLLTVFVRLLLFPLFVKQIKSQRRMQELAPRIKELQRVHKGDRETLNTETMKLYKENNANPISGCLPLILQLPVFFALFSVIREFRPQADGSSARARFGLTAADLEEGGRARIFGAPLSAAFNSSHSLLTTLAGDQTTVRIVAVTMLVLMGATTFWTQRQMMARNTTTDPTQQSVQKIMLYVLPLSFAVFGINFPVGVLLYWLTTNLWSMGQQRYVIARMPPPVLSGATSATAAVAAQGKSAGGRSRTGTPLDLTKGRPGKDAVRPSLDARSTATAPSPRAGGSRAVAAEGSGAAPAPHRPQGGRKKKGRPGGRH